MAILMEPTVRLVMKRNNALRDGTLAGDDLCKDNAATFAFEGIQFGKSA
jgi:hypothetical protein